MPRHSILCCAKTLPLGGSPKGNNVSSQGFARYWRVNPWTEDIGRMNPGGVQQKTFVRPLQGRGRVRALVRGLTPTAIHISPLRGVPFSSIPWPHGGRGSLNTENIPMPSAISQTQRACERLRRFSRSQEDAVSFHVLARRRARHRGTLPFSLREENDRQDSAGGQLQFEKGIADCGLFLSA